MADHLRVAGCLALVAALVAAPPATAQSWRTVTMSRQVTDESSLDVEVTYGVGRFRVEPADAGLLYRMEVRYDEERFEPELEYDRGHLDVGVGSVEGDVPIGRGRTGGRMELFLARDLPMDLRLRFGAVRADLDLGGLALTDLDVATGASESRIEISEPNPVKLERARMEVGAAEFTARHLGNLNAERIELDAGVGDVTLDFTGEWRRDARVEVDMGLGSLQLRFPEGLGVRLEKDSFLTSLDAGGMTKRGDAYYSPDWDDVDRRVTVEVDAALGSIEVVWVR